MEHNLNQRRLLSEAQAYSVKSFGDLLAYLTSKARREEYFNALQEKAMTDSSWDRKINKHITGVLKALDELDV